jgi:hypothetical protein
MKGAGLIVGIDPGKSGGIAWQFKGGQVGTIPMPEAEAEIVSFFQELADGAREPEGHSNPPVSYIEKVGGFIGKPQPGSRMFTFGRNTGVIMGALYAAKFRIIVVSPVKWQKDLGLAGIDAKKRKGEFKNRAHQLFPSLGKSITLKTADALLIFEYACHALEAQN